MSPETTSSLWTPQAKGTEQGRGHIKDFIPWQSFLSPGNSKGCGLAQRNNLCNNCAQHSLPGRRHNKYRVTDEEPWPELLALLAAFSLPVAHFCLENEKTLRNCDPSACPPANRSPGAHRHRPPRAGGRPWHAHNRTMGLTGAQPTDQNVGNEERLPPLSQQRVYLSEVRDTKVETGGEFPLGEGQPPHGHALRHRATRALTPGASTQTQTHIQTSLPPWKTLSHKREKWIKRWSGRGLSSLGVWPHGQLPTWVWKTFKVPSSIVWGGAVVNEVTVFPHV